jgi:hypothetical protein
MARSKKTATLPAPQPSPLDQTLAEMIAQWETLAPDERIAVARGLDDETFNLILELQALLMPQKDTVEGFIAFFKLMTGMDLPPMASCEWVPKAYRAHAEGLGLAQEAHRESAKTTIFSKYFAAFRIGHEPHKVNGIIRINDQKAQETAAAIAYLIEFDPRWKKVFPHVVPDKSRGWGAETGYYVRDNKLNEEEWAKRCDGRPDGASWVGRGWKNGSNIGSRYNGFLIVDDIHDENNTASGIEMKAVKKFYTDTLKFCVMKDCWEIWNFTPWLSNDVYAHIKGTGEYLLSHTPVMVAATPETPGAELWPQTPLNRDFPEMGNIPFSGRYWKLSWPAQWNFDRLSTFYRTSLMEGGAAGFARMMLLDLKAMEGLNLKAEWLHEYPAADIKASWPVIFGIDYASTADKLKNKGRDYFALAIMRALPGGGLVLVDGYRGHVSKGEALQAVASYASMYPTLLKIGVENIGKGEEFYNDLLLTNDTNGKVLPLFAITHGRTSKGDRFENWLAPRFMQRVWIADTDTPFLRAFRNEWINWPNTPNDDCLDAAYMCVFAGEGYLPNSVKRSPNLPGAILNQHPKKNAYSMAFGRN